MELVNPLGSPLIFSQNISLKKTCKSKPSSSKLTIPNSKNYPFHPPLSTPSKFKLYAQFRPPTKRQNYLRKKLAKQQQQVSKPSIIYNPTLRNVSDVKLDNVIEKKISNDDNFDTVNDVKVLEKKKRLLGESVLWNELESWVDQYKKDIEFWGIGTAPIFTVYQESQGKVERVEVNEDEIFRRSGSVDVDSKISYARDIAKEMESGNNLLPRNSSVAKFVVSGAKLGFVNVAQAGKSGFVNVVQGVTRAPGLFPKMSRLGVAVLVGFVVVSAVRKLFKVEEDKEEYTMLEKEMLRRKLNVRAQREKIVKDVGVEVLQESAEPEHVPVERPRLDKEELMNNIIKSKGSNDKLAIEEHLGNKKATMSEQFNNEIQEIRAMARRAREIEKQDASCDNNSNVEDLQNGNVLSNRNEVVRQHRNGFLSQVKFPDRNSTDIEDDTSTTNPTTSSDDLVKKRICEELEPSPRAENWMEKNFHELEPVIEKMAVSFRDSYLAAKEKLNQDLYSTPEMIQLNTNDDDSELDWMKDEKLSDIVFKVRDNELAGKGPFHLMDDKDKLAFFSGLEKKVEQENKKLSNLHDWLHSNIENLDYGADGISMHDPPEKIIPRWKGPPIDKILEFLNNSTEQTIAALAENDDAIKPMGQDLLQKPKESQSDDIIPSPSDAPAKSSKTIIQGSDGSIRAGKSKGKEFWQHTKKWSQGFMDCYNAETDPEMKGVMKDMGKDLDRWITEKEIREAAELMDKLPEKGKKFINDKLDKVRREVELFGPQAVVSKYREYGDEKEEDYLWWLDLSYVTCIELYTEEDGEQRVGLYSLEMAPDLELSPKPYHVIAFEDAGDCKSLCYIIQHHMELLGNGNAFVIARPPKEAFREAKANGFSVTVIRKREMQLNVDQTLEEVEELITEIGSKIYHDSIMRERNVDISALMKGVFGLKKPSRRRRSKRKLKKPTKP